ncbi:MAG: aminotransferase class IV, partial [Gemmataceae bacterium]|nr:aminotransferase class IV [Gemmataceae bacterium]
AHLDDFYAAAAEQYLSIPYTPQQLQEALQQTLQVNQRLQGFGYLIATRGSGGFGPDPRKLQSCIVIWVEDYWPFPPELLTHGLHTVSVRLPYHEPRLLGHPYLVRAKWTALQRGCLEAVLINREGGVLGTTEGSLFLRQGCQWLFPAQQWADPHARLIQSWLRQNGVVLHIEPVPLAQLYLAEEIMAVGASAGVVPLIRLDGHDIGSGRAGDVTTQARKFWENATGSDYNAARLDH